MKYPQVLLVEQATAVTRLILLTPLYCLYSRANPLSPKLAHQTTVSFIAPSIVIIHLKTNFGAAIQPSRMNFDTPQLPITWTIIVSLRTFPHLSPFLPALCFKTWISLFYSFPNQEVPRPAIRSIMYSIERCAWSAQRFTNGIAQSILSSTISFSKLVTSVR